MFQSEGAKVLPETMRNGSYVACGQPATSAGAPEEVPGRFLPSCLPPGASAIGL